MSDRLVWRKRSYRGSGDNDCVEVAWRKSSRSGGGNNSCVEVAFGGEAVGVRDSKNTGGPQLAFPASAWRLVRQVCVATRRM